MAFYFETPEWLISLGILAIFIAALWKRKYRVSYLVCFSIFWIYMSFVLKVTLFPIEIVPERVPVMSPHFASSINLIPFYFGRFASLERHEYHFVPGQFLAVPGAMLGDK